MKLGPALKRLHEAELALAGDFRKLGERHAADHDVIHQTRSFAKQCERHAERLRQIAERYEVDLPDEDGPGMWDSVHGATPDEEKPRTGDRATCCAA